MSSLRSSDLGFIADSLVLKNGPPPKQRHKAALIIISSFLVVLLLVPWLCQNHENAKTSVGGNQASDSSNGSYLLREYSLDETARETNGTSTSFFFETADLPFNLSSLRFGDFREDTQHIYTYYAGSGITLNATGTSARIFLRESNWKLICGAFYHGQGVVAFNGQTTTYSKSDASTAYNGTDIMVQDWKNGDWTPCDGALVEHPRNVTFDKAEFYLLVYEPGSTEQIPEFSSVAFVVPLAAVMILIRRRSP